MSGNAAEKVDLSKRTFDDLAREVRGQLNLGDPEYTAVYVSRVMQAFMRVLREPEVEVRISFDSVTEFSEGCQMVADLVVRFKATQLVDWKKSSDDKDCIEFLNGSGLKLIGPEGTVYLP